MSKEFSNLSNEELLKLIQDRGLTSNNKVKNYTVEANAGGTYDLITADFKLQAISTSSSHAERYYGYLQKIQKSLRLAGYSMEIKKIQNK